MNKPKAPDWAERKVALTLNKLDDLDDIADVIIKLLRAERARAVRVCRKLAREAEADYKRLDSNMYMLKARSCDDCAAAIRQQGAQ